MHAVVYKKYGGPEVLKLKDVAKPEPKPDEVLVKIKASSINSWDYDLLRGIPRVYRLIFGLFRPRAKIIGCDIAGVVESVGEEVTQFKKGDEVFGDVSPCGFGAFAEYTCATEQYLAKKPVGMSFEDAAALPQGGVLALQGIFDYCDIKPGTKILINGAGGSTGVYAIQMAKDIGADVTAVDKGGKLDFLKSMGANKVIDYEKTDYTKTGDTYDYVLDLMAKKSMKAYKKVLMHHGKYVVVGGNPGLLLKIALFGGLYKRLSVKEYVLLMHRPETAAFEKLVKLYKQGVIKPQVDKVFPLSQLSEAMEYFASGNFLGKIVILH